MQGIADKVKAQVKKCWIPQVEETEDVSKVESKFGGIPALKEGELWPPCPNCSKDLTLFLQLNLAEVKFRLFPGPKNPCARHFKVPGPQPSSGSSLQCQCS